MPSQISSVHLRLAIDQDLDLHRLIGRAEQRHLVERQRLVVLPAVSVTCIASGVMRVGLAAPSRSISPSSRISFIRKPTEPKFIPNTGTRRAHHPVQRLQHQPVAAERHHDLGRVRARHRRSARAAPPRRVGLGRAARHEGQLFGSKIRHVRPQEDARLPSTAPPERPASAAVNRGEPDASNADQSRSASL